MLNFIKNRKLKREAEIERVRKELETKVSDAELKMTSSPCALIWPENCSEKCVHFEKGNVESLGWHWSLDEPAFRAYKPRCKLWK